MLEHLAASGFDRAPRFLGIDHQGREALSFIPGDVAYAAYWFVPLYFHASPIAPGLHDLARSSTRLRSFCAAYRCPCTPELLDAVERRLAALCSHITHRAEHGEIAYQRMIAEGHLAGYQQAVRDLRQQRPALDDLVGTS